jgi:hypothetical protein
VLVNEPGDNHTWNDNYLCASSDLGLRWSFAGPLSGLACTHVVEAADRDYWDDNYLCAPHGSPYALSWSSAGPIAGKTCVAVTEAADPDSWTDNYLCWSKRL